MGIPELKIEMFLQRWTLGALENSVMTCKVLSDDILIQDICKDAKYILLISSNFFGKADDLESSLGVPPYRGRPMLKIKVVSRRYGQ